MKRTYSISYLCLQATREGQASYSHVHEIINGLEKREHKVSLFEPSYSKGDKLPGAVTRLQEFIKTQWRLIFSPRCDVLYVRGHFAAFPVSLWARFCGIPVVQEVNGPYEDLFIAWPWTRKFTGLFAWVQKKQYAWANAVIAVTPELVEWVRDESGSSNVHMVSNGANVDLFRPDMEVSECFSLPARYVLFFGALAPWQGVEDLIDAVRDPAWPEGVNVVFVGDGAEAEKVKNAALSNGKIIHLGRQFQTELPGLIGNALASISPQVGERGQTGLFPIKVFESLACGVPIIVTDFPGMADLVRNHNCGLVVPPGSPASIAKAVRELASNPETAREMGKRGRSVVEAEHSWDKRAEQTLEVIEGIACPRKKKRGIFF